MTALLNYFPKGRRLPALERNILKYRAYEMVVVLFHIGDLREYVLKTIRATDKRAIPEGVKKPYEKAWAYLVANGVITQAESDDIQRLTDYRNTIAHDIQQLTFDLSQESFVADYGEVYKVKYDDKALKRLKAYRPKIEKGLQHMLVVLSFDHLLFDAAERTFEDELARLRKKIDKKLTERKAEIERLRDEISTLTEKDYLEMGLYHPRNQAANRQLTEIGVRVCEALFERNLSPLAVSYLMWLSYRATSRRYRTWKTTSVRALSRCRDEG
jgi:hypothetical protein